MIFQWLKNRRRRKILDRDFPDPWKEILQSNLAHEPFLPRSRRELWLKRIQVFVEEKVWVECAGLKITDEIRVTIAGQACLLLLGIEEEFYFDRIQSILVYPRSYAHPIQWSKDSEIVSVNAPVSGEAWPRSPIVLSWEDVLRDGLHPESGEMLVLHEFAHHLDGLDGAMDGYLPTNNRSQHEEWQKILTKEFRHLSAQVRRGEETLLNPYGAENEAEFFAVATECFFCRPVQLAAEFPHLYRVLKEFYREDPSRWFHPIERPFSTEKHDSNALSVQQTSPKDDEMRAVREVSHLAGLTQADQYFTEAVCLTGSKKWPAALEKFTQAVALHPDDSEIYWHRAEVYIALQDWDAAMRDCDQAIELSPEETIPRLLRIEALLGREEFSSALTEAEELLRRSEPSSRLYYLRGKARFGLREFETAVRDFTRAIDLELDNATYYLARAEAFHKLGQTGKEYADLEKAVRWD